MGVAISAMGKPGPGSVEFKFDVEFTTARLRFQHKFPAALRGYLHPQEFAQIVQQLDLLVSNGMTPLHPCRCCFAQQVLLHRGVIRTIKRYVEVQLQQTYNTANRGLTWQFTSPFETIILTPQEMASSVPIVYTRPDTCCKLCSDCCGNQMKDNLLAFSMRILYDGVRRFDEEGRPTTAGQQAATVAMQQQSMSYAAQGMTMGMVMPGMMTMGAGGMPGMAGGPGMGMGVAPAGVVQNPYGQQPTQYGQQQMQYPQQQQQMQMQMQQGGYPAGAGYGAGAGAPAAGGAGAIGFASPGFAGSRPGVASDPGMHPGSPAEAMKAESAGTQPLLQHSYPAGAAGGAGGAGGAAYPSNQPHMRYGGQSGMDDPK